MKESSFIVELFRYWILILASIHSWVSKDKDTVKFADLSLIISKFESDLGVSPLTEW